MSVTSFQGLTARSTASSTSSIGGVFEMEGEGSLNLPFQSVVKFFVTMTQPNFLMPWQVERSEACSGSGFVLKNRVRADIAQSLQSPLMLLADSSS